MGNKLVQPVLASKIAEWCGVEWKGVDTWVTRVTPLSDPSDGALCFSNTKPKEPINFDVALISVEEAEDDSTCLLVATRPRLTFAKALNAIYTKIGFQKSINTSEIDPTAQVSPLAYVAPCVVIGARSIISPFAYIGEGTVIGDDCVIKAGAVIAQDGFGFERDEDNFPIRIIHLGNVVIGDCVEIGSGTTVCRGTLANTVIADHVKIDDHVHIAHNVTISIGAMVIACAEISGGVKIGAGAWVGPNASIIQKVEIGENSFIGIAANVTKNVPPGVVVAGNPAKILRIND